MPTCEMNSVLFEDMNQRVQDYLRNPFLTRSDIVPVASRFHFDVASAILRLGHVDEDESREVLTAVLLLQKGLSIHDDIDKQSGRRRQLYVLTGDFSSSQYYAVLAQLSDGPLLYGLCDAVVRINEAKMALLDLPEVTAIHRQARYYDSIEGELLYALIHRYLKNPEHWLPQIESLVQAHVLRDIPTLQSRQQLQLREEHEWISDVLKRLFQTQDNVILAPVSALFVDYLRTVQKNSEQYMTLSEGNS